MACEYKEKGRGAKETTINENLGGKRPLGRPRLVGF